MSVCTNNCKSTSHGMDNVKFNHTGFVTAAVPFIATLSIAAVKGYAGGSWLPVAQNCRALGQEATRWTARKTRFESRQGKETYLFSTPFSPLLNRYKRYFSGEQSRRGA